MNQPAELLNEEMNQSISVKQISFGSHGIKLNGKLFIPVNATRYNRVPGAVLCHGYGNDQSSLETSAREMAERGIAAIIFDFRGHGSSEGTLDGSTVEDVIDAWEYLRAQPEVDPRKMGLIGHSMGAVSAVMAAGRVKKASVLVGLACPGEIKHAVMENPRHIAYPWFRRAIGIMFSVSTRIKKLKVRVDLHKFLDAFPKMKVSEVLAGLEDCSKLFVFCLNDSVTPYSKFVYSYVRASEPKQILITGGSHATPIESEVLKHYWTHWAVRALQRKNV